MLVVHSLQIVGRCPKDNCPDVYEATVTTTRLLFVEDIIKARDEATAAPHTQEEITVAMANRLRAKVVTVGWHGGVKTTATAGEA